MPSRINFERLIGRGRNLTRLKLPNIRSSQGTDIVGHLSALSDRLNAARGQSSGIKVASEILETYIESDDGDKKAYFHFLLDEFGRDKDLLVKASADYAADPSHGNLQTLTRAMAPKRQELFKRINMAPGGTRGLVEMRSDLLRFLKVAPELKPVDLDFLSLFKTWFNRGFLTMEPISWTSPALVLEHLIEYEAVHEITSWTDLKNRLDPADRHCFGFFHPNLTDNPLIFVEVALCDEIPNSIQDILTEDRDILDEDETKVAAFYSINNCLTGLKGIYFGNFLIKQVVENLRVSHPSLKKFVTLSPIPGFRAWLSADGRASLFDLSTYDLGRLNTPGWQQDVDFAARMQGVLPKAALTYLLDRQQGSHRLHDSVARFHLGNGARIENIHWLADTSDQGMDNSYGIMVNYLYQLDKIETNHEAFAVQHEVALSPAMKTLSKQKTSVARKKAS